MSELQNVVIIVCVTVIIIALFICIMLMYYFYANFKKQALIHPGLKHNSKVSTDNDTRHETGTHQEPTETHHTEIEVHHKDIQPHHEETEHHHTETNTLGKQIENQRKGIILRHEGTKSHHKDTKPRQDEIKNHHEIHQGIHAVGSDLPGGDLHVKQNGILLPKAVLDVQSGQIIKPELCIGNETLALYRKLCRTETQGIIAPPRKVTLLYQERNMKMFQQEHRRAFGSLDSVRETRKKYSASSSRVKMASVVKQDSYKLLESRGHRKDHTSNDNGFLEFVNSSQDTLQTLATQRSCGSLLSCETNHSLFEDNESAVESVNEYFVKPGDGVVVEAAIRDQIMNHPLPTLSCQSETLIEHFVKPADVDIGSIG